MNIVSVIRRISFGLVKSNRGGEEDIRVRTEAGSESSDCRVYQTNVSCFEKGVKKDGERKGRTEVKRDAYVRQTRQ